MLVVAASIVLDVDEEARDEDDDDWSIRFSMFDAAVRTLISCSRCCSFSDWLRPSG